MTWNHTPGSLEAIVDQLSDLFAEWHAAEDNHMFAPASERDDLREIADEAKDVVLQYVSHILGGGA